MDEVLALNESKQVLDAALAHLLVDTAYGELLEVLAFPMRGMGFLVNILLIDEHGVRIVFKLVGNVAYAARFLA